jgi:hypothetical protein
LKSTIRSFPILRQSVIRVSLISALIVNLSGAILCEQNARPPLPSNYKTTFENADVTVMDVHYGAHEFIPMHDHPAYTTLYVYLSDSGEVDMNHENGFVARRPPTHPGAFRIAPRAIERHSVTSLSDTDSDFLRIELKQIPYSAIHEIFRQEAPTPSVPGIRAEFDNPAIRIERIVCPPTEQCVVTPTESRSFLIAIHPTHLQKRDSGLDLKVGDVIWMPANERSSRLSAGSQCLRVFLLYSN